jgi:hypothetical protein
MSVLQGGFECTRMAYLPRIGYFLQHATSLGQGPTEVPWTGADLIAYSLCSTAPNTNTWKRFADVDIQMTCTPDPATGSAGPPPNPGTGTSATRYSANIGRYTYAKTVTIGTFPVTPAVISGSGLNAQSSAPFATYVISDSVAVNVNTDTEVKVTETILIGYVDSGGTPQPGTMYTVTLVGRWFNGRLADAVASEVIALYPAAGVGTVWNQSLITKDAAGLTVFSGGPGIIGGSSGSGTFGDVHVDWPAIADGLCWGYYRTKDSVTEIHQVASRDLVSNGPHTQIFTPGTFSWGISKYTVSLDPTVAPVFVSTVSHPSYFSNDRYMAENDGTLTLFIARGDIQQPPDGIAIWSNSWF